MTTGLGQRLTMTAIFGCLLALAAPSAAMSYAAPAADIARPFTAAELTGPFPSDAPPRGAYVSLLKGFTRLKTGQPTVLRQNLRTAMIINNTATAAQQSDAIDINYDDRAVSLSTALGPTLGAAFRTALTHHRLPKVDALIGGEVPRMSLPLGTTAIEKLYFNNPRPFIVAPARFRRYDKPGGNLYQVTRDPSFPSGHTTQAYWKALLLATWLPHYAPQLLSRAAEIGNSRIMLGVHYPLDVIGGRIMGQAIAADRLADPKFDALIDAAGRELRSVLPTITGEPLDISIRRDHTVVDTSQARKLFRDRLTYGFPRNENASSTIPREAAVLLRAAYPTLSSAQRYDIVATTALPPGYPLDNSGVDGGWQRVDLEAALTAHVTVGADGHIRLD